MNGHSLFGGAQLKEGSLNGVSNQPGHVTNNMYKRWTLGQRTPDPWVDPVHGLLDYPCGSTPIFEDDVTRGLSKLRNLKWTKLWPLLSSRLCAPHILHLFNFVRHI